MSFFPFQNVIANISLRVHPLNKDVSQAIIGTIFQSLLQKMVGWVAFVVSLHFMSKFKPLPIVVCFTLCDFHLQVGLFSFLSRFFFSR